MAERVGFSMYFAQLHRVMEVLLIFRGQVALIRLNKIKLLYHFLLTRLPVSTWFSLHTFAGCGRIRPRAATNDVRFLVPTQLLLKPWCLHQTELLLDSLFFVFSGLLFSRFLRRPFFLPSLTEARAACLIIKQPNFLWTGNDARLSLSSWTVMAIQWWIATNLTCQTSFLIFLDVR